jgi:hypothetical protein
MGVGCRFSSINLPSETRRSQQATHATAVGKHKRRWRMKLVVSACPSSGEGHRSRIQS